MVQTDSEIIEECCGVSTKFLTDLRELYADDQTKRFIIEYLTVKAIERGFADLKKIHPKEYAVIIKIVNKGTKIKKRLE